MGKRGFTDKQRQFIDAYIVCLNATKAAIAAGYSKKTARQMGSENLSKLDIRAEIDRRLNEYAMSANEVMHRLTTQARSDIGDFARLEYHEIPDHPQSSNIKKLKRTVRRLKDDDVIETTEIELYDAQSALVHLGRAYGIFKDVTEIEDWRSRAIADIKAGNIEFKALADHFDHDLATELFRQAGVRISATESETG